MQCAGNNVVELGPFEAPACPLSVTPFALEAVQHLPSGTVSPPASSCSTGGGGAGLQGPSAPTTSSGCSAQSLPSDGHGSEPLRRNGSSASSSRSDGGSSAAAPAALSPACSGASAGEVDGFCPTREWLYWLVTFPAYFTPCHSCTSSSRTPKREQLMTQFDTEYPYKVYCSHCPECKVRSAATLLQVRRSAFKDVVKATDITRFDADIAGVQQYTLNGSKVIYLNREQTPEKKGAGASAAPAACSVDGRAMMDKSSQYCSLKCKMHAEDPGFNFWLDQQDPSVRILAQAAANAPPRPTVASKRVQPSSSGSGSPTAGRSKKAARTSNTSAGSSAVSAGSESGAAPVAPAPHAAAPAAPKPQQRVPGGLTLSRSVPLGAGVSATPVGLRPIRTSGQPAPRPLPIPGRQQSAPGAFLEAALAEPQLGLPSACKPAWSGDLDNTLSCSWDSGLSSPAFAVLPGADAWAGEDGSMSPQLINAPRAQGSVDSSSDWWLAGSGGSDAFADVGMGALLLDSGLDAGLLVPGCLDEGDLLLPAAHTCLSGASLMC